LAGRRQCGFSLLELLVTLFVIVVVTSLVALSVSSGRQDIELEAGVRNLAEVAAYALDEAQLSGRDYGLLLTREQVDGEEVYGYAWRERAPAGWRQAGNGEEIFRARTFPPEYELQLELEDSPVTAVTPAEGEEVEQSPQVLLYASGETTVGAIDVRRRDNGELLWRVRWDLLGRFELLPRGEEPPDE
jgi:general secretion pathway protein H